MQREEDKDSDPKWEGAYTDYDQLGESQWGLDWGDVSQIRERLQLTPTERLELAQRFVNRVFRIRAQNGG